MAELEIPQPYPGIRPFRENDWPIFFGREAQSNQLLHKLETTRFVAVVGSSGSGKSSLVRAGLIPLIRQGFLRDVKDWDILLCRPGVDPFAGLAYAISRLEKTRPLEGNSDSEEESVTSSFIAAELRASPNGIVSVIEKLKLPDTRHILLIVDQFEEIFGFRTSSSEENAASRGEAERFIDCMLQSCAAEVTSPLTTQERSLPQRIWALLTMRSDFIGHCEVFPALARWVSDSQFLVPVLNSEQKKEAITRPGETKLIDGATYAAFDFDDGVVSVIVNETGDRLDQLPLMQHALMRTWKLAKSRSDSAKTPVRVALDDYQAVGRIDEALHNDAENAWKEIATNQKLAGITQQMFLLLCDTSDEGKLTRKRPKVSAVMAATGARLEELETILGAFQRDDRNFLRPIVCPISERRLAPDDALDVSHEALLRQWRTYRSWQIAERHNVDELVDLRRRANLNAEGEEPLLGQMTLDRLKKWRVNKLWARRYVSDTDWESVQHFIEKSKGRRKLVLSSMLVGLVIVLSAALWVFFLWSREQARGDLAKAQAEFAKAQAQFATAELNFERDKAQKKDALRLIGIIGSSDEDPSIQELATTWELAELQLKDEPVRTYVIKEWFGSVDSMGRALARDGQGLVAAIGIYPPRVETLRDESVTLLIGGARDKVRGLPEKEALSTISAWLPAAGAKQVAEVLVESMEDAQESDLARLPTLGRTLASLLELIAPDEARALAKRGAVVLGGAIDRTPESDPSRVSELSSAFAKVIQKMALEEASLLATSSRLEILTKALEKAITDEGRPSSSSSERTQTGGPRSTVDSSESDPLSALGNALVIIAKIMKPAPQDIAARGAKTLVDAIEHLPSIDVADGRAFRWAGIIGELAKMMNVEKDAADFRSRIGLRLSFALGKQPRSSQGITRERWSVVADLYQGLKVSDQVLFDDKLIEALDQSPEASAKLNLSFGLAQLAAVMPEDERNAVAQRAATIVLKALQKPPSETDLDPRKRPLTSTNDTGDLGNALARLAKVMKPKSRGPLVRDGIMAIVDKVASDRWRGSDALTELSRVTDIEEIPKISEALVNAMQAVKNDAYGLYSLGTTIAELSARLKTVANNSDKDGALTNQEKLDRAATQEKVDKDRDRASVVLIKALEDTRNGGKNTRSNDNDSLDLLMFAIALSRVDRAHLSAEATTVIGRASTILLEALEKAKRAPSDLSTITWGLLRLNMKMTPEEANRVSERATSVITTAIADAQKAGNEPRQVSSLANLLGDFCKTITKTETRVKIASDAGAILVASQGSNARETANLGEALLTLVQFLPTAKVARDFALYERMSAALPAKPPGNDKEPEDRQLVITECGKLDAQELAEILKWPCCVGEAQKIVLTALEKKLEGPGQENRKFDGSIWKFVDQASEAGITNLDGPAARPSKDKALNELAQLSPSGR